MTHIERCEDYCRHNAGLGPQYTAVGILWGLLCGAGEQFGLAIISMAVMFFVGVWYERSTKQYLGIKEDKG